MDEKTTSQPTAGSYRPPPAPAADRYIPYESRQLQRKGCIDPSLPARPYGTPSGVPHDAVSASRKQIAAHLYSIVLPAHRPRAYDRLRWHFRIGIAPRSFVALKTMD